MPSITSLVANLAKDYPHLHFMQSDDFLWNPHTRTVLFTPNTPHAQSLLLHETAHALLNHEEYRHDIELLKIEREAWDYALDTLAPRYAVDIESNLIEETLDTYRDWLHKRSTCPHCHINGLQATPTTYRCLQCRTHWTVNEARTCRLQRTSLKKTTSR